MKYHHCVDCGKEKLTPNSQRRELCISCASKGKTQSEETRRKISEAMKNPSEETRRKMSIAHGGTGVLGEKKSCRIGHNKWAKDIKERDGACIDCGSTERLQAHHLVPYLKFPEVANELWNGITLCRKCHITEHKIIGYR